MLWYERDNSGLLLALGVLFGLQDREFWDDNQYPTSVNVDGGRPFLDPCHIAVGRVRRCAEPFNSNSYQAIITNRSDKDLKG